MAAREKKHIEKIKCLQEPIYNDAFVLNSQRTPSRLDPVHIPFLRIKLKHLDEIIATRNAIARQYNNSFDGLTQVQVPRIEPQYLHSFRNYTIKTEKRDELKAYLAACGIESKIFYEQLLYLRNEFAACGHKKGDFPVCETAYASMLSLPVSHSLNSGKIEKVIIAVKSFFKKR